MQFMRKSVQKNIQINDLILRAQILLAGGNKRGYLMAAPQPMNPEEKLNQEIQAKPSYRHQDEYTSQPLF